MARIIGIQVVLLLLSNGAVFGCRNQLRRGSNATDMHDVHTHHHKQQQEHSHPAYPASTERSRELAEFSSFPCGSQSPSEDVKAKLAVAHRDWKTANEQNRRNLADIQYTIDVVVHVIYESNIGYVEPSVVQDGYIATLQRGFSKTPFTFNLREITYSQNASWYNCGAGNEDDFKQALYVQGKNVLNVYICDPWSSFGQFGAYGWSSLPVDAGTVQDGIVILNPSIVDDNGLTAYTTLIHECAHFLGLFHTFEGGCQPGTWNNDGDLMSGDGVADTPAHFSATENYVGADSCWTDYVLDTCQDVEGIDPGTDPTDNYMNYLTPTCWSQRGQFTDGQIERMLAEYEQYRSLSFSSYLGISLNGTEFGGGTTAVGGTTNSTGKSNETVETPNEAAPTAGPGRISRWSFLSRARFGSKDP